MRRIYAVTFDGVAVSVDQDLFQIGADTLPITIHSITLSQETDLGDAQAEGLRIRLRRVSDSVTDGVNAVAYDTNTPSETADLAVNQTTPLVEDVELLHVEAWNIILGPFLWVPTAPETPWIAPGDTFTVNLAANTNDAMTMSGTVVFEEVDV